MTQKLSEYFKVQSGVFEKLEILDSFTDIDTPFFIDPLLLKDTTIPEFIDARTTIEDYFRKVIKLIITSTSENDIWWKEAKKMLLFPELRGVSIGYGSNNADGSGIGPKLRDHIIKRASELIKKGVNDPELFELVGLFIKDFGPDRLSDMVIRILRQNFFSFTQRITQELKLEPSQKFKTSFGEYLLPIHPNKKKVVVLLPRNFLRDLPIAQTWEDIDAMVHHNDELRRVLNEIIGNVWKKETKEIRKIVIKEYLLSNPKYIQLFISSYKAYVGKHYDYDEDKKGELAWYDQAKQVTSNFPLTLLLKDNPTINDLEVFVVKILTQFKKNIEENGINEFLYSKKNGFYKPRHEKHAQLLFYMVSDIYCSLNNIDLSREPNAGKGPVDFKYSRGYELKYIVEIKKSSSSYLVSGYTKQIRQYERSESVKKSTYVIIRVGDSNETIKTVLELEKKAKMDGKYSPKVFIIDARMRPSASKL